MSKLLSIVVNFEDKVVIVTGLKENDSELLKIMEEKAPEKKVFSISKTLTVKEIYDDMDSFPNNIRGLILKKLIDSLTRVSKNEIAKVQEKHNPKDEFDIFIKEQNKEIKSCVKVELTKMGEAVRKEEGLKLLHWDTPFSWELLK